VVGSPEVSELDETAEDELPLRAISNLVAFDSLAEVDALV